MPKNIVEEPFCVKFLVPKKVRDKRGGGYHDFLSKLFCLTVAKNFVGQPFRVSLISGIEKFYPSEGYVTIFCRNFFSQCQKISYGNPSVLCFRKFPVAKKFMDKGGGVSRFSVENFLFHSFGRAVTRTPNLLLENAVVLSLPLSFIFE